MLDIVNTIDSDILVIGGGCAGMMAAIVAKHRAPTASVCVMEKGHVKRSGSVTTGMDALNVAVLPGVSTVEEYVDSLERECDGIFDHQLSYILGEQSYPMLKLLEQWGVFFPKDADGNYYRLCLGPDGEKRYGVGMDEPDFKLLLERKLRKTDSRIMNNTCVVALLVKDGRVHGALGLDVLSGDLIHCRAKSVILANGSAGRFGLPSSGYLYGTFDFPGNAGDGFSLASRAGAWLTGMEHTMSRPLVKDLNVPLLHVVLNRGGLIVDQQRRLCYDKSNLSLQHLLDDMFFHRGRYFLQTDHLSRENVMEIENVLFSTERPLQRRYYEEKNIRLGRDLIELAATENQLCGGHGLAGLVIDGRAATSIRGLYAAGDVSSVAVQCLTGALVFGRIAGGSAVEELDAAAEPQDCREQIAAEIQRLRQISPAAAGQNSIEYSEFEYRVRKTINDYCLSPKSDVSLRTGLARFADFREQLPTVLRVADAHELWKAVEIGFILDCAEMSAVASLTRTESRWGTTHLRTDHPQRNDEEWLKHIDVRRAPDGSAWQVRLRDIERTIK